jgi:hypothetical protein
MIQQCQYPKKSEDLRMVKKCESIDDQQNQQENRFASQIVGD